MEIVSSPAPLPDVDVIDPGAGPSGGLAGNIVEEYIPATPTPVKSPHLNPDWLRTLKQNYQLLIIDKLSQKVRDAVDENRKFEAGEGREMREIRSTIVHGTLDYISDVFGEVGRPKLAQMREVANVMGSSYPGLFRDDDSKGYGLGGQRGVENLANNMLDILRGRQGSRKRSGEQGEAPKKGKRKLIYGKLAIPIPHLGIW